MPAWREERREEGVGGREGKRGVKRGSEKREGRKRDRREAGR